VLKGVDLDLFQGENLVVLGRSGTGKSVLIKIIAGLLKADEGYLDVLVANLIRLQSENSMSYGSKSVFLSRTAPCMTA
jgi:phospholipid/cholesterol/gamma-HCH transport system ATP-binding protein